MTNEQLERLTALFDTNTTALLHGSSVVSEDGRVMLAEITQLRGNLSRAEEGLASAMQEIEQLRAGRENAQLINDNGAREIERLRALLVEVYNHGENVDLHRRIGVALGAAPGEDASPDEPGERHFLDIQAGVSARVVGGEIAIDEGTAEKSATEPDSLDLEVIREDYQTLTGVCPLPGPQSKKSGGSLRTPQGEPALTQTDGLPGTREPVSQQPHGIAGESPALFEQCPRFNGDPYEPDRCIYCRQLKEAHELRTGASP